MAEDSSVLNYFKWNSGEPNNEGNEDAVHIIGNGYWNDNQESGSFNVVCVFVVPEYCIHATSGDNLDTLCAKDRVRSGDWQGGAVDVNRNGNQVATISAGFTDQRVCIMYKWIWI